MKCDICGKKMPPTVIEAHLKKSHGAKPAKLTHTEGVAEVPTIFPESVETKDWDWGEINTCQQCKEEWPSRLMELHMTVRHGM